MTYKIPEVGTSKRKLYDFLKSGGVFSNAMALQFGISGSAAPKRLQELKNVHGLNIKATWVHNERTGKHYNEYRVVTESKQSSLFNTNKAA